MVRALDHQVLYTSKLVLTSGVDGPHPVDAMVLTPHLVLTSGVMVHAGYNGSTPSNLVLTSGRWSVASGCSGPSGQTLSKQGLMV